MDSALQLDIEPPVDATDEVVRILLVDDDPAYSHLCKRYLSKHVQPRFEVVSVATAALGLEACQNQHFDCLLVDYTLPDIRGTQVLQALTLDPEQPAPPTIIMTADGGERAASEAVRAGATDFLSKRVISPESLIRAVNNAVEKGRLQRSVAIRSKALEVANQRLSANNEQIQRFYQSVSHEVKTPLAAAREFIAIVIDGIAGPITDYQEEMLTHALDSCDQITAHFNDLIEMTRLDAKKIALNRSVNSVSRVIARCFAAADAAVEGKQLYIKKRVANEVPEFPFDCNRIIQVLSNLLGNAIKFTPQGGTITVTIAHDEVSQRVSMSVADTGCGIAPEDLDRVFDRLYQVDETGDELMGAGLGLGLSIAQEIVALHGGEMAVESIFGEGSTFSFWLPTAIPDPNEAKEKS